MIKCAINQVYADNTKRFLLRHVRLVEHAHVNDDLAGFSAAFTLKTNTEPAMRLIVLLKTACCHRIGKNKKCALSAELLIETLDQKIVFVIEHGAETFSANVAIG